MRAYQQYQMDVRATTKEKTAIYERWSRGMDADDGRTRPTRRAQLGNGRGRIDLTDASRKDGVKGSFKTDLGAAEKAS